MSGTIAIPRGHFNAPWPFIESLTRLYDKSELPFVVKYKEGALIPENRNSLSSFFEGDWIMFIDSDIAFLPDQVERIIWHIINGKNIVCGLVFKGQPPHEPLIKPKNYIKNSVVEIESCHMGFTAISRKVFNKLGTRAFDRLPNKGEDLSFCKRATDAGFKIYCDTSVFAKHIRYYYVSESDYKRNV